MATTTQNKMTLAPIDALLERASSEISHRNQLTNGACLRTVIEPNSWVHEIEADIC